MQSPSRRPKLQGPAFGGVPSRFLTHLPSPACSGACKKQCDWFGSSSRGASPGSSTFPRQLSCSNHVSQHVLGRSLGACAPTRSAAGARQCVVCATNMSAVVASLLAQDTPQGKMASGSAGLRSTSTEDSFSMDKARLRVSYGGHIVQVGPPCWPKLAASVSSKVLTGVESTPSAPGLRSGLGACGLVCVCISLRELSMSHSEASVATCVISCLVSAAAALAPQDTNELSWVTCRTATASGNTKAATRSWRACR